MDAVEYVRGSKPPLEPEEATITKMVVQTPKAFAETPKAPHCMVNQRKFMAYNNKPNSVRLLQRLSLKFADLEMPGTVLHVAMVHPESEAFVVVCEGGSVCLVKATELPDRSVNAEVAETYKVPKAVTAAVAQRNGTTHSATDYRANKQLAVFTASGDMAVVKALDQAGATPAVTSTELGAAPASVSAANGLVAFAAKSRVRLQSLDKPGTEILAKPWVPHGDDSVDFVAVLRRDAAGRVPILTSSGNEVRFWTLDAAKGAATLHQTALLSDGDDAKVAAQLKCLDADEDYAFFVHGATGRAMVLELGFGSATGAFCVERITEWALGEEVLSTSPIYRKVAATAGAPPRHEMSVVVRTVTGVKRIILDQQRLIGPGNVAAEPTKTSSASASASPAGAPPSLSTSDVMKRFGLDKAPASAPSPAAMAPSGFTHITSTSGGQTTTKSSLDPRMVQEALAEQQRNFVAVLRRIDATIVSLERAANESIGALRAKQAAASAAGEAAGRAVARDIFSGKAAAAPGSGDAPLIRQDALEGFTRGVSEAAVVTVQQALQNGLKQHVNNAADRAAQIVANNVEKDQLQLPKLSSLPSMQGVADTMDKVHAQQNELFRRQKEQDQAKLRPMVRSAQDKAAKQKTATDAFLSELRAELSGLKSDLAAASSLPAAPASATESEEAVFASAMQAASTGSWETALVKVTGLGKTSTLMQFLESDLIRANQEELVPVVAKSVPLFVAAAQQLTSGLADNVGLIPSRTAWLHAFAMAFDEYAEEARTAGNKAFLKQLEAARVDFSNIADAIQAAEALKSSVDRSTRRALTVSRNAINEHGL